MARPAGWARYVSGPTGAAEAIEFVRRLSFDPPSAAFDAAFSAK